MLAYTAPFNFTTVQVPLNTVMEYWVNATDTKGNTAFLLTYWKGKNQSVPFSVSRLVHFL